MTSWYIIAGVSLLVATVGFFACEWYYDEAGEQLEKDRHSYKRHWEVHDTNIEVNPSSEHPWVQD